MATPTLTAEERQQRLNEASDRYMLGEITAEQLEEAKRQYAPDYRPALRALAENLHESGTGGQQMTDSSAVLEFLAFLLVLLLLLPILHRLAQERNSGQAGKAAA